MKSGQSNFATESTTLVGGVDRNSSYSLFGYRLNLFGNKTQDETADIKPKQGEQTEKENFRFLALSKVRRTENSDFTEIPTREDLCEDLRTRSRNSDNPFQGEYKTEPSALAGPENDSDSDDDTSTLSTTSSTLVNGLSRGLSMVSKGISNAWTSIWEADWDCTSCTKKLSYDKIDEEDRPIRRSGDSNIY